MTPFTLVVTLRKDTETPEESETLYNLVKERLSDRPDVKITGHVTNHYEPAGGQAEPD